MIYDDPRLRSADAIQRNRRGQSALWKYGISGDLPIVLARFPGDADLGLFHELLRAHEYLRVKGFTFDLVVLNEQGVSYRQDLQNALQQMLDSSPERAWADHPGGVFLRRIDLIPPEDQLLLAAVARVVMDGAQGNLEQQLVRPQTVVQSIETATSRSDTPRTHERRAARPDSGIDTARGVQRPRRICRRRPRVRRPRRAAATRAAAGAVVERRRAADISASSPRSLARLHLVREQPRKPADAVAERSGSRPAGRGRLHSRRRDRQALVGDAAAGG